MNKQLTLIGFILIIFTSVFGFANIPIAYYLMGYSAIPWYILAALLFFVPYAFMMGEYGAAFKNESGGIYTWMAKSVGPNFAFIGTFMWFASYVIWMVGISSKIWIPFSNFLFGSDQTQTWSLFGLNGTQTVGVLAILWIVIVTFFASRGLKNISKITTIGGIAVMALNIILLIVSVIIFILTKGSFAQPIEGISSFVNSPNNDYGSFLSMLAFMVFALFAYGGIEAVGGLVDKTDNPTKNFPKGIIIAASVIAVGYSLGIFLAGIAANWNQVFGGEISNMGNITYILLNNLGVKLGLSLQWSPDSAAVLGAWFAKFAGLAMFCAYSGAFFTLIYAPIKTVIQGTPKHLWPKSLTILSNNDMPVRAMWVQCAIIVAIILLITLGGPSAKIFFKKITLMANVAMTLPVLFLAIAFPFFKKNQSIAKPYIFYKSYGSALIASTAVVLLVGFANIFTIIEPAMTGQLEQSLWMIAGPLFFSALAMLILWNGRVAR